jgi:hypothetical protein
MSLFWQQLLDPNSSPTRCNQIFLLNDPFHETAFTSTQPSVAVTRLSLIILFCYTFETLIFHNIFKLPIIYPKLTKSNSLKSILNLFLTSLVFKNYDLTIECFFTSL